MHIVVSGLVTDGFTEKPSPERYPIQAVASQSLNGGVSESTLALEALHLGTGRSVQTRAAAPRALNCRISENTDDMEALHVETGWTPGKASIRPTPAVREAKTKFLEQQILPFYESLSERSLSSCLRCLARSSRLVPPTFLPLLSLLPASLCLISVSYGLEGVRVCALPNGSCDHKHSCHLLPRHPHRRDSDLAVRRPKDGGGGGGAGEYIYEEIFNIPTSFGPTGKLQAARSVLLRTDYMPIEVCVTDKLQATMSVLH